MLVQGIFSIILTQFLTLIQCELTLEKIDAIADLSAVASKYFSIDSENNYSPPPDGKILNAFAWSVSEMWDQTGSGLYVLTRLAKLVDEKDESGEIGAAGRAIKSFAGHSEARQVYFTTIEASSVGNFSFSSSNEDGGAVEQDNDEIIEKMYSIGQDEEADRLVKEMIISRWTGLDESFKDIESSISKDQMKLFSSLIKFGSDHQYLKYISSDDKSKIMMKILLKREWKLDPISARWLFTMDIFKEDQLKLVKLIETNSKLNISSNNNNYKNDLVKILDEVKRAENCYLKQENMTGIDDNESLYKMAQTGKGKKIDSGKKQQKMKNNNKGKIIYKRQEGEMMKANFGDLSAQALQAVKEDDNRNNNADNSKNNTDNSKNNINNGDNTDNNKNNNDVNVVSNNNNTDNTGNTNTDQPFKEQLEREAEIDRGIYEVNDTIKYDNDGVYDEQEQKEDRAAQIVVVSLIGGIVFTALLTYAYLRMRRAKRNRTMLVVTEALETVA